jgi:hypothetical protein
MGDSGGSSEDQNANRDSDTEGQVCEVYNENKNFISY